MPTDEASRRCRRRAIRVRAAIRTNRWRVDPETRCIGPGAGSSRCLAGIFGRSAPADSSVSTALARPRTVELRTSTSGYLLAQPVTDSASARRSSSRRLSWS
jgi:hypothetical protein